MPIKRHLKVKNIYFKALKKVHKEVEKIQIQKANEVQIDTSSGREESKI